MTYIKNTWVDQEVERPKTYEITNNADGSITLIDSFGLVSELGTPVNADNMNHIEEGIAACDLRKYNYSETYNKGEWATAIIDDKKNIYQSLTDDNIGNPVTDTNFWQKVELGSNSGASLPMFTPVIMDHLLTYEEFKGFALQGTYVYSTAIAGERYGYPDFIKRCIDEKNLSTPTSVTFGDSTLTMYIHANGHQFYDITDKAIVDAFFATFGVADFYGVDETNSRVFLPRNDYFMQVTTNLADVNKFIPAGLPAITHTHTRGTMNIQGTITQAVYGAYGANSSRTGAFKSSTQATTTGTGNPGQLQGGGDHNGSFRGNTLNFKASDNWTGSTSNNSAVNSIYGNSSTVQPPSSKKLLYYVVGNTVSDTSWIDVVTDVQGAVKDIVDAGDQQVERINATGKSYDNLTYRNITNCITEIPEHIKYTLEDGVLTILAGTVVILPYGTATTSLKIGDNFPTEDYKIVDFKNINGQNFFWIEFLQNKQLKSPNATRPCFVILTCENGETSTELGELAGYYADIAKSQVGYNPAGLGYATDLNEIRFAGKGLYTFPLMLVNYDSNKALTGINQVFNSMGYVGTTVWADKGIKGLFANGKNPNESYKSTPFETDSLMVINAWANGTGHIFLRKNGEGFSLHTGGVTYFQDTPPANSTSSYMRWYSAKLNTWFVNVNEGDAEPLPAGIWVPFNQSTDMYLIPIMQLGTQNSSMVSWNNKQTFQAADTQNLDGQWTILKNNNVKISTTTKFGNYTYNIANILPNDGYSYEVKVFVYGQNATTNVGNIGVALSGSTMPNSLYNAGEICLVTDGSAQAVSTCGNVIVSPSRNIYVFIGGSNEASNSFSELSISITGYKRLGKQ